MPPRLCPTRRLLWTSLALTGSLLTVGCNTSESATAAFAKAETAIAEQSWRTAVIELKNALAADAEHPELSAATNTRARVLLGQALLRTGSVVAAEQELTRAQKSGAPFADYQPWLAQAWLQTGKVDAITALKLPDNLPAAVAAELLALQATAEFLRGNNAIADDKITAALARDPQGTAPQLAHVRLLLARNDTAAARQAVQKVLAKNGKLLEARILLGDIERVAGKLDAAEAAYAQVLTDDPALPQVRLNRTLVRIQAQRFDAAREDIATLREQVKQNPQIDYAEGLWFYAQKNYTEAIRLFDIALGVSPNLAPALFFLGASHLALGQNELAYLNLQRFVTAQPNDLNGLKLLGTAALQTGKAAAAEKIARDLLKQTPQDTAALDLLANALASQGKTAESLKYLQQVKAQVPASAAADARLGVMLLAHGDTQAGLKALQEALAREPTLGGAAEQLISGYLRSGEPAQAVREAQALVQREPKSAHAHAVLGAVHAAQRHWPEAEAAFKQALALDPGELSAMNGLVAGALERKDVAGATQILRTGLTARPDDLRLLLALAKLAVAQQQPAQALQWLQQAVDKNPTALEPKLYLAAYYLQQQQRPQADAIITPLLKTQPTQPALLELAAESALAANDFAAARQHLEAVRQQRPTDARLLTTLARAEMALGNVAAARTRLQEAVAADPKFVPALAAHARLALTDADPAAATKPLQALTAALGADHPDVLLLTAQHAQRQGQAAAALTAFTKLLATAAVTKNFDKDDQQWALAEQFVLGFVRAGDKTTALKAAQALQSHQTDSARVQSLLGLLYLNSGQIQLAERSFEKALKIQPGSIAATNGLAALALQQKQPDVAQAHYERSLAVHPNNIALLSGLANVALVKQDKAGARRYLETAVKTNDGALEPKLQLAAFDLQNGQPASALTVLLPLQKTHGTHRVVLGLLAEAYGALRDNDAALKVLEQLATVTPNDAKVWLAQANALLNNGQLEAAATAIQKAQQQQADVVAVTLMQARLAIAQTDDKALAASIATLQKQVASRPALANDVLLLEAKLAELKRDWTTAIATYRQALEKTPTTATVLRLAYAQTQAQQAPAAEQTLTQWLQKNPQDAIVQFSLAQQYLLTQREADAIRHFEAGLAVSPNNAIALNNLAWLLRERDPKKALEHARAAYAVAPKSAEIADTLAVIAMQQGQIEEARQLNRQILQAQPNNPSFLFHRAQIFHAAGDKSAAVQTLEQLLADPKKQFAERAAATTLLTTLKGAGN